jgi:hypothetical protein
VDCEAYRKGLLDVGCHKVIVTILASRAFRLGSLWWKFGHALHCRDVVAFLCGRKGSPASVSLSTLLTDVDVIPFPPDNNVQRVALLPLVPFLRSLVDLLVETSDASVKIGGQDLPTQRTSC